MQGMLKKIERDREREKELMEVVQILFFINQKAPTFLQSTVQF